MFEELAVLVEVFDGVGMVGAWAIHELVEVVRHALLGLLAHAISCGDQRGVGRSAPILFVLLAPLRGGALILVLVLGLAFVQVTSCTLLSYKTNTCKFISSIWLGWSSNTKIQSKWAKGQFSLQSTPFW